MKNYDNGVFFIFKKNNEISKLSVVFLLAIISNIALCSSKPLQERNLNKSFFNEPDQLTKNKTFNNEDDDIDFDPTFKLSTEKYFLGITKIMDELTTSSQTNEAVFKKDKDETVKFLNVDDDDDDLVEENILEYEYSKEENFNTKTDERTEASITLFDGKKNTETINVTDYESITREFSTNVPNTTSTFNSVTMSMDDDYSHNIISNKLNVNVLTTTSNSNLKSVDTLNVFSENDYNDHINNKEKISKTSFNLNIIPSESILHHEEEEEEEKEEEEDITKISRKNNITPNKILKTLIDEDDLEENDEYEYYDKKFEEITMVSYIEPTETTLKLEITAIDNKNTFRTNSEILDNNNVRNTPEVSQTTLKINALDNNNVRNTTEVSQTTLKMNALDNNNVRNTTEVSQTTLKIKAGFSFAFQNTNLKYLTITVILLQFLLYDYIVS